MSVGQDGITIFRGRQTAKRQVSSTYPTGVHYSSLLNWHTAAIRMVERKLTPQHKKNRENPRRGSTRHPCCFSAGHQQQTIFSVYLPRTEPVTLQAVPRGSPVGSCHPWVGPAGWTCSQPSQPCNHGHKSRINDKHKREI